MTSGIKTVIYPVRDLARARALYGAVLGVEPDMDGEYYVGFSVGDQQIGLDPRGHHHGMTGPSRPGSRVQAPAPARAQRCCCPTEGDTFPWRSGRVGLH